LGLSASFYSLELKKTPEPKQMAAGQGYSFVAVIATFGNYVLLGQSGKWAMDGLIGQAAQSLASAQRFAAQANTPAAKNLAKNAFAQYAESNNLNVGEISWKPADANGPARYSTKYIRRDAPNTIGFIKGTVSPVSGDPVALKQKAIEEFKEEVGMTLAEGDLVATAQPNVFVVDMTKKVGRKEDVINAWRELRPFTELVTLAWVRHDEIPQLNQQSQSVRHLVPAPVGGRRRTLRSKSKRQKMRSKQWSLAKSSRSRSRH